jgi:hypothetical protein
MYKKLLILAALFALCGGAFYMLASVTTVIGILAGVR